MNIGLILAAGYSTRFKSNIKKQVYKINDKPLISYSIDNLINNVHIILIITNDIIKKEIEKIINNQKNIILLVNNNDSRLESINIGLTYINNNYKNIKNIIIHDSARPFITESHIIKLLNTTQNDIIYSQYYLTLVNGLMNIKTETFLDRNEYIETCTPICIDFMYAYMIFKKYINENNYEFIPILKKLKLKYLLFEDKQKYLRKITTIDDIY
jgi:2-C-methyl-D-erythritol 4-phosphate cytidylyltransferase